MAGDLGQRVSQSRLARIPSLIPSGLKEILAENGLSILLVIMTISVTTQVLIYRSSNGLFSFVHRPVYLEHFPHLSPLVGQMSIASICVLFLISPLQARTLLLSGIPIINLFSEQRLLNENGGVGFDRWSYLAQFPLSFQFVGAVVLVGLIMYCATAAVRLVLAVTCLYTFPFLIGLPDSIIPSRYAVYFAPALSVLLGRSIMALRLHSSNRWRLVMCGAFVALVVLSTVSLMGRVSTSTKQTMGQYSAVCNNLFFPVDANVLAAANGEDVLMGRYERSMILFAGAAAQMDRDAAWPSCRNWPPEPPELFAMILGQQISDIGQDRLDDLIGNYRKSGVWTIRHQTEALSLAQIACSSLDQNRCSNLVKLISLIPTVGIGQQ